jgi:hypothetical protein
VINTLHASDLELCIWSSTLQHLAEMCVASRQQVLLCAKCVRQEDIAGLTPDDAATTVTMYMTLPYIVSLLRWRFASAGVVGVIVDTPSICAV